MRVVCEHVVVYRTDRNHPMPDHPTHSADPHSEAPVPIGNCKCVFFVVCVTIFWCWCAPSIVWRSCVKVHNPCKNTHLLMLAVNVVYKNKPSVYMHIGLRIPIICEHLLINRSSTCRSAGTRIRHDIACKFNICILHFSEPL